MILTDAAGVARRRVRVGDESVESTWGIAVEVAVELRLNDAPWTVMLATPADLEDLAVGLALTEGLIAATSDVALVSAEHGDASCRVALTVPSPRRAARARTLPGATGCGICGLESLDDVRDGLTGRPVTNVGAPISDDAVATAWRTLPDHQPINTATRSVHAAAWCTPDGTIVLVREDVGRHNALDKLVGALARSGRLGEPGFVAMTSRCSVELVTKASVTGARLLATISAPTTLALTTAETLRLPLACMGPGRQVVRFPVELAHAAR